MKQKDINKQAQEFGNSLIEMARKLQSEVMNIQAEEAKKLNIDIDALNREAKQKVDELKYKLKEFENKIKTL